MQINTLYKIGDLLSFKHHPRHSEPFTVTEKVVSIETKTYSDNTAQVIYLFWFEGKVISCDERDILCSTTGPWTKKNRGPGNSGAPLVLDLKVGPFYGRDQFCTNGICASIRGDGTCSKSRDKYMSCENKDYLDALNKQYTFPDEPVIPAYMIKPLAEVAHCGYVS